MKILRIPAATLQQVLRRPGQTLRILGLPTLIGILSLVLSMVLTAQAGLSSPMVIAVLLGLTGLQQLLLASWAAVNFHRHVLLGERFGVLPRLHLRETARYALGLLLIVLLCLAILIPFMLVLVQLAGQSTHPGRVLFLARVLPAAVVYAMALRLAGPLPGLAIGRSYGEGFGQQQGTQPLMIALALLIVALSELAHLIWVLLEPGLLSFLAGIDLTLGSSALLALLLLVRGFAAILGISLLTAIYASHRDRPAI
ncbi:MULTISPECIES: hypothetical protein [Paracoccus]|uniref:hypothetical protein n=1 Tax=Paracoccus TaxID=265 RepID=UPI00078463BC|nr:MULTISPECIES: hypothetical protein [Paracoccus]MCV2446634.1 hypothetical protein [Paracoccus sp. DMF]MDQ7776439.1 hypothetical protein [Paracoccus aminovorans]